MLNSLLNWILGISIVIAVIWYIYFVLGYLAETGALALGVCWVAFVAILKAGSWFYYNVLKNNPRDTSSQRRAAEYSGIQAKREEEERNAMKAGKFEAANNGYAEAWNKIRDVIERGSVEYGSRAAYYYACGNSNLDEEDWIEAEFHFHLCVQEDPNYVDAWNNLGWCLAQQGNFEEAFKACQKAYSLDEENIYVWDTYGFVLMGLGRIKEAIPLFQRAIAAKADNRAPLEHLSAAYTKLGLYSQATTCTKKLADLDQRNKQHVRRDVNDDKPHDETKSLEITRKAAIQGDVMAQYELAQSYEGGKGGLEKYIEAAKWFRRAAEHGYAKAQFKLAIVYANGRGVPRNDTEAAKWYRKAAEQGDVFSQNNLGAAYYSGNGVPQDFVEAYKWLSLGTAKVKPRYILEMLEKIINRSTPEQIAEGQKRAAEFVAKKSPVESK